jgi:hypothetical protein
MVDSKNNTCEQKKVQIIERIKSRSEEFGEVQAS